MPKAEKGTPKDIANRMKSRGLQKLAFYCQVCEKQMRDQNGFKQHCASEAHVRMMLLVGQNPNRAISDYSQQFKNDFLQLLRTSHGEKRVQANHFYQQYIQHKSHIHMNGTHWKTLSEFVKSLGRDGICRVEDGDEGLFVSWIDNSPEALKRQAAIMKKDRQQKGDEQRANQLIAEQIRNATAAAKLKQAEFGGNPTAPASGDPSRSAPRIQEQPGTDPDVSVDAMKSESSLSTPEIKDGEAAGSNQPAAQEHIQVPAMSFKLSMASTVKKPHVSAKKVNVFAKKAATSQYLPSPESSSSSSQGPLSNAQRLAMELDERNRRQEEVRQRGKEDDTRRAAVH